MVADATGYKENVKTIAQGHEQIAAARRLDEEALSGTLELIDRVHGSILRDGDALERHGHQMNPLFMEAVEALENARERIVILAEGARLLAENNNER